MLFFEQSGTFKNEFIKLGIPARDYDIKDDFEETDHIIDLFQEINNEYDGIPSIFDYVHENDLIMAFFPCIRFTNESMLLFRGQQYGSAKWNITRKMAYCMKLQHELTDLYLLINKLFIICIERGFRLIVENPYSKEHYLRRYWCLEPSIIDTDRRLRGDYYKKPTQYWFVNCDPENNEINEVVENHAILPEGHEGDTIRFMTRKDYEHTGAKNRRVARSMIHPDYANRFIREFILDKEDSNAE